MKDKLSVTFVFLLTVLPSLSWAESKKTKADRELARELSAGIVLLSDEISNFADVRDQLAKNRVQNMQALENNLVWLQEGNDFDQRVWKVVGETYRLDLLQGVLDATDDLASRRKAAAERQAQQAQQLVATSSAINRRTSELGSASASLAALAEPPISGVAVAALIKGTLSQLASNIGDDKAKLKQGLEVATQLAGKVESKLTSTVPTD